ncbi:MAG: hypothetical protein K6G63_04660 [Eubacterium sp.]|nr:hypothetical protein [Eubacterium sp.]
MKYKFIPAFVMLLAGFVCCIISIVQRWDVLRALGILAVVLIIFYILGQIFAQAIGKVVVEREAALKAERERQVYEEAELAKQRKEEARKARHAKYRSDSEEESEEVSE